MIGESYEIAHAAKKNNGIVIANVGLLVEKGYTEVFLPGDMIDAIVLYPDTEQTGAVPHRRHWSFFTTQSDVPMREGIERVRLINRIMGLTPQRDEMSNIIARLAARVFAENVKKGSFVTVGTGLPEEVCRLIYENGQLGNITLMTEGGSIGGVPASGIYFGAAVCPEKIISSAQMFKKCYERLDAAMFGVLQADSAGNVNVSKRGEPLIEYVGPGGFIDFSTAARTIIFVSSWMAHGKIKREKDRVRIAKVGKPKFVDKVAEITFHGQNALSAGKKVFYVTDVGVFKLTEKGMELTTVMPGIDIKRDIWEFSPMKVVLPESGNVPVVDSAIVTGKKFDLEIRER
jgi:propionate CoA-transferase